MRQIIKQLVAFLVRLLSKIYTYGISQRLKGYKNSLYTLWIRNFIGEVGTNVLINYPCLIQGGGEKRIFIGNETCLQGHNVLESWVKYKDRTYTPSIVIGCGCNIGEYTHITAINNITIGDGLMTGRFVYIGDNAHGRLSMEEANIPPAKRHLASKGDIKIGRNVWIGDKVTIV
jgi:acetyltransferase-like isoleucine patch superfamily enzyme